MRQELRYAWEFREGRKIEACLRQDLRYDFAISGIISDLGYIEVLRHTSRGNEDGLKYLSLGYAPNIEGIPQRNSSYTPSQNRGMPLFEVEVYLAQVIGRYQILHVAYPKWVWDIPHLRRTTPNTCQSRHASIRADSLCDECKCGAPI